MTLKRIAIVAPGLMWNVYGYWVPWDKIQSPRLLPTDDPERVQGELVDAKAVAKDSDKFTTATRRRIRAVPVEIVIPDCIATREPTANG